jgi:predicted transcriptional regulator
MLVSTVGSELGKVGTEQSAESGSKLEPAVSVRRSIASDHLVCLVCGKKQKLLKRHLIVEHSLTPDEYRKLFDLKADYPVVAPSYAQRRRELAVKLGLGRPKKPVRPRPTTARNL